MVCDLFCVLIDVTPFIFHAHTHIHCAGFEIESVDQQDINNKSNIWAKIPS